MSKSNYKVLILGGGADRISVAAKLSRELDSGEIAIVDPADKHFYQPLWTVTGTGLMDKTATEKNEEI